MTAGPAGTSGAPRGARVWVNGAIVDGDAASVPVFDRGFLYGDSVYEVLRTYGGRPFALDDHLDRLDGSAARLAMTLPPRGAIEQAVRETAAAVAEAGRALGLSTESYLRIVVTRGGGAIGLDPALADAPRLLVVGKPLELPDPKHYTDGVGVALVGARRNAPGGVDPLVKSGNYLSSVLAIAEARQKGAYEAVMCDSVGRLAECSSSNLFLVGGARLATPPLSVGILEGITRRHVIEVARAAGFAVDERPLWPVDLERADEAFLTSSVRGVVPIVRADFGAGMTPIGGGRPGPVVAAVRQAYEAHAAASAR